MEVFKFICDVLMTIIGMLSILAIVLAVIFSLINVSMKLDKIMKHLGIEYPKKE